MLTKFLFTAHSCMELRNFATCMAILDGLENLIIKQLPAWKHLPTKCINIREGLESARVSFVHYFVIYSQLNCRYSPFIVLYLG